MTQTPEDFGFEVMHFGVNSGADTADTTAAFASLFGIAPIKDGVDSVYMGPLVELMKQGGRGTHGHIAIGANSLPAARAYLEKRGCVFDEASAKHDADGRMIVLYFKKEMAGFAVHLMQK